MTRVSKTNDSSFHYHRFNPWRERFDEVIQNVLQAGLVDYWKQKTWIRMKEEQSTGDKDPGERDPMAPLGMDDLQVGTRDGEVPQMTTSPPVLRLGGPGTRYRSSLQVLLMRWSQNVDLQSVTGPTFPRTGLDCRYCNAGPPHP